jgi:hypothetical protein
MPERQEKSPIGRLSFVGENAVAVIRANGDLELWNCSASCEGVGCKGKAGTRVGPTWSIWPINGGAVLVSPQSLALLRVNNPDSVVLDFKDIDEYAISSVAVAGNGDVAIGTFDGLVVLLSGAKLEHRNVFRLPNSQRVSALSFWIDGQVLAVGEFPGLYVIGDEKIWRMADFEGRGVRRLISNASALVFVDDRGIWYSAIENRTRLSSSFDRSVAIFSLYLALLGLAFSLHSAWRINN